VIIYPSSRVLPYVYIGIHKITGHIYIGSRTAENLKLPSHLDLFRYRTSSKTVRPEFDQYNWTIVAEFFNGNDAYDFEQELIYCNWHNLLLMNKNCHYNSKKRFKAVKGIPKPEGFGQIVRDRMIGKCKGPQSKDHIEKRANSRRGKTATDEQKQKYSLAQQKRYSTTADSEITRKRKSDSHNGVYEIKSPDGRVWITDVGLKEFATIHQDELKISYWQLFNAYRKCYNNTSTIRKRKDNNNWQVTRIDKFDN